MLQGPCFQAGLVIQVNLLLNYCSPVKLMMSTLMFLPTPVAVLVLAQQQCAACLEFFGFSKGPMLVNIVYHNICSET